MGDEIDQILKSHAQLICSKCSAFVLGADGFFLRECLFLNAFKTFIFMVSMRFAMSLRGRGGRAEPELK